MLRQARRVVVAVTGGTVLLVGVAMVVLPGPAIVVIPAGLAILATEFVWAHHLLRRLKEKSAALIRGHSSKGAPHGRASGAPAPSEPPP